MALQSDQQKQMQRLKRSQNKINKIANNEEKIIRQMSNEKPQIVKKMSRTLRKVPLIGLLLQQMLVKKAKPHLMNLMLRRSEKMQRKQEKKSMNQIRKQRISAKTLIQILLIPIRRRNHQKVLKMISNQQKLRLKQILMLKMHHKRLRKQVKILLMLSRKEHRKVQKKVVKVDLILVVLLHLVATVMITNN